VLQLVNVGHKSLADYASLVQHGLVAEIERLAEPLRGKRVVHVSATAFGGGVAEINYTLVPLMADVGLDVEWRIIRGAEEFFNVTKAVHNALQGDPRSLTANEVEIFRRYNAENALELPADEYDFVIVHDPQPIGMIDSFDDHRAKWIWRGHIDFSEPNEEMLALLIPSLRRYDAAVFHMREYVPHSANGLPETFVWPPAIDPLTPKNMALSPEDARYIVDQFGIDVARPMLTQVSRFDPWKDPLGVIDAYRRAKETHPGLQLALVGSMAHDDPEGWDYYHRTVAYADNDPDIFILSNMNNVGAVEVNAFQVHAAVTIQKSIREGFGLTVSEALWKTRPVVAGRVGGIVTQIEDGVTGWLVDSAEECARACSEVLADAAAARDRAVRGKETVRRRFLTPRLLHDWLALFNRLGGDETAAADLVAFPAASEGVRAS
jgi:trehalose synthase